MQTRTQASMVNGLRKNRFTLVELLVVIAIISVLAGMLLPSLENAIGAARQINCANNQKQISYSFAMYTSEYDDWICPSRQPDGTAWTGPIYKYFNDEVPTSGYLGSAKWNDKLEIALCPAEALKLGSASATSFLYGHYLANGNAAGFYWSGSWLTEPKKITSIKTASQAVLLGDSSRKAHYYCRNFPLSYMSYRHGGGDSNYKGGGEVLNVAYLDSHVDTWNAMDVYFEQHTILKEGF